MNNAADEPSVFLGIDAAWTENGSTGVAVIARSGGRFRLVAAEPSYSEFVHRAFGKSVKSGLPDAAALVGAARNWQERSRMWSLSICRCQK